MKKTLAWLLTLFMVLTISSVTVFATEPTPAGNDFTGYTSADAIWGEVWGNAKNSFVINILDANDNVMGTTSLNNVGGIIDGDVNVTWNIKLDAASNTDEYWTMSWTTAPSVDNMPAKVELWVDGVKVSGGNVVLNGPDSIGTIVAAVADSNGKILSYATAADMQTAVAVDGAKTILMLNDVTLADGLALPAGVTLNGNGKTINGTISADGDLTIAGVTKVAGFSAGWYNHTITIGPGASLEITGGGRMTLGYGNIFNITGSIVDAKTVDLNTVVPSLKLPAGISITGGNGAALNVKNAYIEAGLTSSKPGAANGTFDINLTNSVAVFTGKFALDTSTGGMTPVFNTSLKDSVMNVAGNLVFGNTGCNTTIDNSVVNANSSFRNDGSLNLINGSVLNVAAMIQAGENGGNSGTIVVDNSTLNVACSSEGHAIDGQGTGVLEVINGGEASIDYITKTDIEIDIESKLTSKKLMDSCSVTVDAEGFNGGAVQVLDLETPLAAAVNVNFINSRIATLDAQGNLIVDENAVNALGGSGAEADPYTIGSVDDLTLFAELVNSGNDFAGKTVQLTADIDLAGIEWTPIGNNAKQFKGYFDGNNKTISNLTVTGKNDYAGLFGYIKGNSMAATATPTVKNLNLTGVNVSGDYYVGALSGQGYTCSVVNVHVQGTVTGTRYVGGLIGHVYTYFKDCSFTGNASCTFDALGGIAGAGDCRAYDCKVVGDITGSNWVGGIVGNGQEGTSAVGCYVKGTVSSDKNYYRGVGGIAGVAGHGYSNSEFKNNYFDGEVYLCGEKVDAIIMGIVNADNNDSIGTTVEGNSWNTEYYPATTPVYVVAEISSSTASAEEWIAGASEEKSDVRNNNLVMLESDLAYIDAEDADDVTIMQFSDVTEGEVAHAVIVNKSAASITDSNGVTTYYDTLEEALKAVTDGCTLEILSDITIASDWDNRTTGAKIAVPVTIDGNGYTLKFTGMITDGYNYLSAFRFEAAATVKDLTIDLSEATSQWAPRLRAISAKTDITIDNCTFIGNAAYNNTNAVIIGEGAGAAMGDVVITITNSTFTNWRNGISDNQNGQDAKTVAVTGNTFNNANARIAAKNSVVFNNNTMNNGGVTIASFTTPASLAVTAKENTLATGDAIVNEIKNANTIDVQSGFTGAVASVNGTIYGSLEAAFAAAQSGNTVVLLDNVNAAVTYAVNKTLTLDLNGYTIESDAAATLTATAGGLTIVDSSADQTGAIVSAGKKAIHSSAYVAIQSGKFVGTITTANNQADDSQVCITGGNFSVEPNANIIKHTYVAVLAEDETYNVIPDEYEVIINGNGGTVAGEGFYEYGDIVYISAGTNSNYVFAGWLSDDVVIQNAGSRDAFFVMPDHSVTVSAYWASSGVSTPVYPILRGTLHFETNGGTAIDSISGTYGAKVDLAQYVTIRQGYTFAGWYSDAALSKPVTQITMGGTKTVYAGWIETPVIPDIPVVTLPFTDVAADAYYYNAVLWAVAKDITNGISDTAFGPDMVCTRAQVVTFLWRAAGCPVATGNDMPFTDVSRDVYYYDAVLWAVEQGITNGISDTEFGADDECTRAQIVTFLWRSQGSPEAAADGNFSDVDADAYYATAVEWAVDNGVTNGVGDDAFAPDAECTRAQTVTFLYRYFVK